MKRALLVMLLSVAATLLGATAWGALAVADIPPDKVDPPPPDDEDLELKPIAAKPVAPPVGAEPAKPTVPATSAPVAAGSAAPDAVLAPPPPPNPAELRASCVAALNADPNLANSLLATLDEKRVMALRRAEETFRNAHIDADKQIRKNQAHVIMAYAAMWLAAVAMLLFMWRRQRALQLQIVALRADVLNATRGSK